MQSDLEREMSRQLSLMQHKAVDPWPAFETELHFDWCCEHRKVLHGTARINSIPSPWCHACARDVERVQVARRGESAYDGCEHEYERGRDYRADFAYPAHRLLIEVDGAVYTAGRHTRGKGYENDARKNARAVELGYRTLRFSGGQVKSGEALNAIGRALEASRGSEGGVAPVGAT